MAQVIVDEVMLREPNLLVPGKKPIGPVRLDYSNENVEGLSSYITRTPIGLRDLVKDEWPSANTSIERVDWTGKSAEYSSAKYTTFSTLNIINAHTIIIIFDLDTLTNYGALAACQNSSTTNGWELRVGFTSTDSNILFHRANSSLHQMKASSSNLITAGTKRNFVGLTCADYYINSTVRFNVNGTFYTGTNAYGAGTGAISSSTHSLYLGRREDSATYLDGSIHTFMMWGNRKLSDSQMISLYKDPYQVLIPA